MLDGILGRGFAAKCKSLIKLTKSRIDVIRRKRKATEKFLKRDVADLLANGLDINAYGRADGLLAELMLSSCYDFVEQSCDFVLKHLPVMQKISGCPEECREAVSSLMFAAARFSDLPELRDIRQIFQERYGSSLECYVNKEFAEICNSKSSTLEKKVHLMEEIALEFSIKWDSKAFGQRMSKPSAFLQDRKTSNFNHVTDYNKPSNVKATQEGVKYDALFERSPDHPNNGHRFYYGKEASVSKTDDHDPLSKSKPSRNGFRPLNGCDEAILKVDSHHNSLPVRQDIAAKKNDREYRKEGSMLKPTGQYGSSQSNRVEQFEGQFKVHDNKGTTNTPRESQDTAAAGRPLTLNNAGLHLKSNVNEPYAVNNGGLPDIDNSVRKVPKDEKHRVKSHYNHVIPPPYVKKYSKQKHGECGTRASSSRVDGDAIPSVLDKPDEINASERIDDFDRERQAARHSRWSRHNHEKEFFIPEDAPEMPVPKPKSLRRKHSQSRSRHNVASAEDTGDVTRRSRSRRRDQSRRGLQILFDDEQRENDEEERIMDKLLIHYSKKPNIPVPEKTRKSKSRHAHEMDSSAGEYVKDGSRVRPDETQEITHTPRSSSLPREQTQEMEVNKVYTRAATFQPDRSGTPPYVHPKLPDYDDLAARFAALRGR